MSNSLWQLQVLSLIPQFLQPPYEAIHHEVPEQIFLWCFLVWELGLRAQLLLPLVYTFKQKKFSLKLSARGECFKLPPRDFQRQYLRFPFFPDIPDCQALIKLLRQSKFNFQEEGFASILGGLRGVGTSKRKFLLSDSGKSILADLLGYLILMAHCAVFPYK